MYPIIGQPIHYEKGYCRLVNPMFKLDFQPQKQKWPPLILWIGLFGIGNFVVGCWSLLPPIEGHTVYFWLVRFYSFVILPSLIIFSVSWIVVALWFARLEQKLWNRVILIMGGIAVSGMCFVPALGSLVTANLRIIRHVEQDGRIYYLVENYTDLAYDLHFCKSDKVGFSGKCTRIAWRYFGTEVPAFYIDQSTNLITVRSEDPSFIWTNSVPPSCRNDVAESKPSEHPGGCVP